MGANPTLRDCRNITHVEAIPVASPVKEKDRKKIEGDWEYGTYNTGLEGFEPR
jgi:hypothetical protein